MSWRGLAGPARPARRRSLATGRLHRTAPRRAGLDCSWPVCRGTVVPKCPGPDRSGPGPPWTVPRGLTRPIARSRVLRWTCPPRSHPSDRSVACPSANCPAWVPGPDCSGPGPARNGVLLMALRCRSLGSGSCVERVSRRLCPDHSGPASAGLSRLVTPRLLGTCRRGTGPCSLAGDCSPVHVSEPITDLENPCRIAVSRVPPRSGSHLPDRPPFPATSQVVVVAATAPQGFSDQEFDEFLRPQVGPQASPGLSPGNHRLSTGSSTEPSTSAAMRVQHVDDWRAVQSSTYGQCRQPRPQHVPLSARNRAVRTNSPLAGSR
jgi:hypothetical protein